MRRTYNHAVIYGIKLNDHNLELSLLEVNPEWNGETDSQNPHWLKSETKTSGLKTDDDRRRFSEKSGNVELLLGTVFPDGSVDRNLVESGYVKNLSPENVGELCYLHEGESKYLGLLLLHNSTTNWGDASSPSELQERLYRAGKVVEPIRRLGFDIKPTDLQVLQTFFTRYESE